VLKPRIYLLRMVLFLIAIAGICVLLAPALQPAFLANIALNGMIAGVLLIGILTIFRQVWTLTPEVAWIENVRSHERAALSGDLPRLLSPLATMLGDRRGKISLSPVSMRTLLDGIGARLDEQRETSRYLIGVLVFLGLLGTFYGLLETVRSVGGVIASLSGGGGDVTKALNDLKESLATPLAGMSTAFSSSLFGLAGSLVLGFLDLQAGQAQNRFFYDLEEWLSGLTRISSGAVGEGDQSVPAFIQALLEQTADSLDNLQRIMARGEDGRHQTNQAYLQLTEQMGLMTEQMRTQQNVLLRIAELQQELRPVLSRLAEPARANGMDDAARTHLGNLDRQVARIVEETIRGREQTVQEIRSEIRLLARTIAALAEDVDRE